MDERAYGKIVLLVNEDIQEWITELQTSSGRDVWNHLHLEYVKDTPSSRMTLCIQFYTLTHDFTLPLSNFITALKLSVRQLKAIGHEPITDEITNKLLMSLDSAYTPIHVLLANESPQKSFMDMVTALSDFESAGLKKSDSSIALVAITSCRGMRKVRRERDDSFDWGNSKEREGVCYQCGRVG